MIKLVNVIKVYKNKTKAIDNISIEFADKGIVYIKGISGSGKTTLLNIISGITTLTSGNIIYDDCSIEDISYVTNNNNQVSFLNWNDNLKLFGRKVPDKIINKLKLEKLFYKDNKEISGGESKKIGVIQKLFDNNKIILLDEPLKSLDESSKKDIMDLIKSIANDKLIVIAGHDSIIEEYANRVVELNDGKLVNDIKIKDDIKNNLTSVESSNKKLNYNILIRGLYTNNLMKNIVNTVILFILFSFVILSSSSLTNNNYIVSKELIKNHLYRTYVYDSNKLENNTKRIFTEVRKYYIDEEAITLDNTQQSDSIYYEVINNDLLFSIINKDTFNSSDKIIGSIPINGNEVILTEYLYNCLFDYGILNETIDNSIGKTIKINNQEFIITGILRQDLDDYNFLKDISRISSNKEINTYNIFNSGISSKDTIYVSSNIDNYLTHSNYTVEFMMYSSDRLSDILSIKNNYKTEDAYSEFICNFENVLSIIRLVSLIVMIVAIFIIVFIIIEGIYFLKDKYYKDFEYLLINTCRNTSIVKVFSYYNLLVIGIPLLLSVICNKCLLNNINSLIISSIGINVRLLNTNYVILIISIVLIILISIAVSYICSLKVKHKYFEDYN